MAKPHFKKKEDDSGVIDYGDVKIDAESADVIFTDPSLGESGIMVVISNNPDNPAGASVAVLTADHEDVDDNELLGSATIDPDETAGGEGGAGDEGDTEEARKAEARKRFQERFAAKCAERKKARTAEKRRQACEEARQRFRARAKKA